MSLCCAQEVCEVLFPEVPPLRTYDTSRAPAEVCRAAATGGHRLVLEWAHAKGFVWDASVCSAAAHMGDLQTIIWLKQRGCPWDKSTTCRAEMEGYTEVLKWCREHGCEYSEASVLRMKMMKLNLAMAASQPSRSSGSGSSEHVGSDGVIMVTRHPPCWPDTAV